jgi:hypothetical protein
MIHVQLLNRKEENLHSMIRAAIAEGHIKSFQTAKVVGGLKITHKKHLGVISISKSKGPLIVTISCKNREKEWQLLEAFIGRIAYHFAKEVAGINIQFKET